MINSSIQAILNSDISSKVSSLVKWREEVVLDIIEKKFGVNRNDKDAIIKIMKSKKLAIMYSHDGKLLGVCSNNRWLYTLDGRTIGKCGRRYKL